VASRRDEIRQVEPEDGELSEEWLRETSEPDLRGINVTRWADGGDWPWQVGVYVAQFVREEPLESELRRKLDEALRAVAGVEDVAEQDRELWIVRGHTSGAALTAAAAGVVDEMADRLRAPSSSEPTGASPSGHLTRPGVRLGCPMWPTSLPSSLSRSSTKSSGGTSVETGPADAGEVFHVEGLGD
jgi:hypothetical protein